MPLRQPKDDSVGNRGRAPVNVEQVPGTTVWLTLASSIHQLPDDVLSVEKRSRGRVVLELDPCSVVHNGRSVFEGLGSSSTPGRQGRSPRVREDHAHEVLRATSPKTVN